MNTTERIIIIFLSGALLTGATILYKRYSRPCQKITIIENGIKEQLTLREVEKRLKERRRVNINTATPEEVTTIPGIGEVFAARIVDYRDTHGKYYRAEDLLEVEGIGEKKLEKIKEYIKIE
ncbi:MAG: helix-hairpin-helix domain-containing protein [Candidatus Omnitrophota bacterium]|nr:helix-hairpin-helix domain-containing protein [Candidatus Omnitrophota bacterium]